MNDDLEQRIEQYQCFELPGQPMTAHMGTSYLINDLWKEVNRLRAELGALRAHLRQHIRMYRVDDQEYDPDAKADRIMQGLLGASAHAIEQVDADETLMQQALDALHEIHWSNDSQWQSERAGPLIDLLKERLK